MTVEPSTHHIAPWMHIIPPDAGIPLGELLPASGNVHVARLSGPLMTGEVSTFQQFDAVLKFPPYFGWNWDAFHDCLRDLQWLSADHHVVIIESADQALAEDDAGRRKLLTSLWRSGRDRSYVKRPEGITLSRLSVILTCDKDSLEGLSAFVRTLTEQRLAHD